MWSTPLQIRVSRPTDNSNAAQLTCLTAVEGQYRITTASFLTGTHLGFYGVAEHPCPKLSNFSCPAGGVAPWAIRTDPTRISLFCPFFFSQFISGLPWSPSTTASSGSPPRIKSGLPRCPCVGKPVRIQSSCLRIGPSSHIFL
jgi:hypothetical protein